LNQIGEEGVPFLLAGMDSPSAQVRGESARLFPSALARKHVDELIPRLQLLLKDQMQGVRENAFALAVNGHLIEMRSDLEAAIATERDPKARKSLQLGIMQLKPQK
jgi:hypothetical protein